MNRLVQFLRNIVWAILLLIYMPIACVQASPEIMTVDQLQPGMHGVAKTVIKGTAVESFDVEIIGVLRDGAPEGMILGRVSGDVISQTAGVLQGMSGSPVYILSLIHIWQRIIVLNIFVYYYDIILKSVLN